MLRELAHDFGMHSVNKDSFEEVSVAQAETNHKDSQTPTIINTVFQISGDIHQLAPKSDLYILLITKYNLCYVLFSKRKKEWLRCNFECIHKRSDEKEYEVILPTTWAVLPETGLWEKVG